MPGVLHMTRLIRRHHCGLCRLALRTQELELTMSTEVTAGSIVQVRDEEWLVSSVEQTDDGPLLTV